MAAALLRARQILACAACDAHGIDGEQGLITQKRAIEDAITDPDPVHYRDQWTAWLNEDIALLHGPDQPHPDCYLCGSR